MPKYVTDASVVAKWILPGEPAEKNAVRLKEDSVEGIAELHAPSIIIYEVGNILWKASKTKRIAPEDAEKALNALTDMTITLHDLKWKDISEGFNMASALDLTIYDIAYVFLSNKLQTTLITADEELYARARKQSKTLHLKDYQ